jgi:hypothetical protein
MRRRATRWVGAGLTAGAVLAILVAHAVLGPTPVGASECCQVCEAKEAACYAACQGMSHEEGETDTLSACYTACEDALYFSVYGCWANCTYCGQPPSPQQCFQYYNWHVTQCSHWTNEVCDQWETIHEVSSFAVDEGWCTP